MKFAYVLAPAVLAAAALAAGQASAATLLFDFTLDGTSGGGLSGVTGPFGTVTATDNTTGGVDFNVALASNFQFHASNAAGHQSLDFLVPTADDGNAITGLASPFKRMTGTSFTNPPFTNGSATVFDVAIKCVAGSTGKTKTACQSGYSSLNPTSMSFHMAGITTGNLESIYYQLKNVFFTADISYKDPKSGSVVTGNIGATEAVPEPATWALMILGVGMIGAAIRRRNSAVPA